MLFRFYQVNAGGIYIDDINVDDCTQDSLRQQISMVPQDTMLFNDTIRFNILYGNPQASEAEIQRAVELSNLQGLIDQLPDGLETLVGERGLKLSGGEVQRVAIARAILKRPRIIIFDEATSSLDSETEVAVMEAIRQVTHGVTSVIIAHRLSTVVDADRICVLNNGELVEQGQHQTLLTQQGLYAHLWALQQSANERETVKNLVQI